MADFGGALDVAAPVGRARSPPFCRRCRISSARCARLAARWPEPPKIVLGEDAKYAAFRAARAGARRIGHGDARTRACRRADGRRLQGLAGRGAAQISDQGPLDPVAQPHPRRAGDPGVPAARLHARRARRGACGHRAGRPGAPRAARGAVAARSAHGASPTAARRAPTPRARSWRRSKRPPACRRLSLNPVGTRTLLRSTELAHSVRSPRDRAHPP